MTYLVLARKYRPKRFQDLVGQEHVVRALTHALESGRLHHAYLFTGTRGVGKTTLSRILAKCLNCEKGVTAEPCGECEACRAIDADRFVDYIELDAASNRGVGDMQQLLEQAIYAPTAARYKVYMIDEVHMLSNQAFNAMLKTLEEPPEYVKFILATTDPQKIPVTVLSRCLQFNLKQMPQDAIVSHLSRILAAENIGYEQPALRQLARGAQGSMRDALSLTDQAIAYTAGNVTADAVQDMLGALDQTYLVRFIRCLQERDGKGMIAIADEMATRGLSYSTALQDLASQVSRIAMIQCVPDYSPDDMVQSEDLKIFAQQFSPEEIQLYYQIAIHGLNEIGLAPDEYAGFTMTLLRMLAFAPASASDSAPRQQPVPARKPSSVRSSNPVPPPVQMSEPVKPPVASQPEVPTQTVPAAPVRQASRPEAFRQRPGSPAQTASVSVMPKAPVAPRASAQEDIVQWNGDWPSLVQKLHLRGLVQQLAYQTELIDKKIGDGRAEFVLQAPVSTLCAPNAVAKLTESLTGYFGCPVRIRTQVGKVGKTAGRDVREAAEARQHQAEEAFENDPYIQDLAAEFGARIVEGSIKPI